MFGYAMARGLRDAGALDLFVSLVAFERAGKARYLVIAPKPQSFRYSCQVMLCPTRPGSVPCSSRRIARSQGRRRYGDGET